MSWRSRRWLMVALSAIGIWQISSGLYIHAKAFAAQQLIASAWTRILRGEPEVRPWPWADTWPIARLQIPAHNVDLYVLADASGRSLAFGPGHVSGSAAPGTTGNSIIAAHRDTHFRFLQELRKGTRIVLQTRDRKVHEYAMRSGEVIDIRSEYLDPDMEGTTLTLLTCYPFEALLPGGPLRYAAIAVPTRHVNVAARQSTQPPHTRRLP